MAFVFYVGCILKRLYFCIVDWGSGYLHLYQFFKNAT